MPLRCHAVRAGANSVYYITKARACSLRVHCFLPAHAPAFRVRLLVAGENAHADILFGTDQTFHLLNCAQRNITRRQPNITAKQYHSPKANITEKALVCASAFSWRRRRDSPFLWKSGDGSDAPPGRHSLPSRSNPASDATEKAPARGAFLWRRRRDSIPRTLLQVTRFPIVRPRPN